MLFLGVQRKETWSKPFLIFWAIYPVLLASLVCAPSFNLLDLIALISPRCAGWFYVHIPFLWQWISLGPLAFLLNIAVLGWLEWILNKRRQQSLKHLGLKTPTGLEPKIVKEIEMPFNQRKLLVMAVGLDVEEFRNKKGAIESAFNSIVQDIRVCESNRQMIEILLADKALPRLVQFDSSTDVLNKPYSFIAGLSNDGYVTADLTEVHHLLIAGTTGGGKSGFFKQALIGLLKSSEHLQLYIVDLKRGVEAKPFEPLANVRIIKENVEAVSCLEALVKEMDRRYDILAERSANTIDPKRDNLDRLVVAIDEASVLFTIDKSVKANKANALSARELTDKLTKLGRAAGIHVILATQKVQKETIDTRIQANINARICFRMQNAPSSLLVLNTVSAMSLPEIPGRGIWSMGSREVVVQVPKLSGEDLISEVGLLTNKFNASVSPLKQKMVYAKDKSKKKGFTAAGDSTSKVEDAEEFAA